MAPSPLPSPARVFIDTSVLFAAALSPSGFARDLIVAGVRGTLTLVISPFVIEETRRSLAAKASRALPVFDDFLALELLHVVDPPIGLVQQVAENITLKDAPIIAGAMAAGASFLATFDRKHLLAHASLIRAKFGVIVGTPQAILATIDPN